MKLHSSNNGKYWVESDPPGLDNQWMFDKGKYPEVARGMSEDLRLREWMTMPYHEVLREHDIPVNTDLGEFPKDRIRTDGLPHHGKFVKNAEPGMYVEVPPDDGLLNSLFSRTVLHSAGLEPVIRRLEEQDIFQETQDQFVWCEDCKCAYVKQSDACERCSQSHKTSSHSILQVPSDILREWIRGGDKFIEAMAYRGIKTDDRIGAKVFPRKDVMKQGSPETEIDVIVPDKNVAVLATTSPQGKREKYQSKICQDQLDLKVAVVTTQSSTGRMKHDEAFTSIDEDSEFPSNLADYVAEL